MQKIRMTGATFAEAFADFIMDKRAEGLREKTLEGYYWNFKRWTKYIRPDLPIQLVTTERIQKAVTLLAQTGVSPNTVRSYTATLQSFLSYCHTHGLTDGTVTLYKGVETVPETYTSAELCRLLAKPKKNCRFSEYRNWVITNLLVSNGIRASSLRAIQIRDVDLDNRVIYLRHMKRRKAISIPLCDQLVVIFKQYLRIRNGGPEDVLFPNEDGSPMTESSLHSAIVRYNHSRDVKKTGIHMYRHTFARLYLVDCGGDTLKLKRLLGHSTLDTTNRYIKIYASDLVEDYRKRSPLDTIKKGRS